MKRLPIRLRLTLAFSVAMAALLAGESLFVDEQLRQDLDEAVTTALEARMAAPSEPGDFFTQLLERDGRVVRTAGGPRGPALTAAEVRAVAAGKRVRVERKIAGIHGTARVLAVPARGDGMAGGRVLVAGMSLDDRDEALKGLVAALLIGGPVAVIVASLLAYALATAALRPVERMRQQAEQVSLADERLPLPQARDEVRRLGETLNAMLVRLDESAERERRFVADASHELRIPITVVKAELEGVLRAGRLPTDAREALAAAVAETDALAQLAEDLLVLARASDGALPLSRETLDAREALERAAQRFADRAAREGRSIDVRAPEGLVLYADPLRLRQAIGNLVDNALRYGSGAVVLDAASAGGAVELCVSDDGTGFPSDLGNWAFERFARGDAARTRTGAGLGLAIVRAIAEAHGGTADVASGAPTTVRLRLPAEPQISSR